MEKVKYGNDYIYIDTDPVDEKETGIFIDNGEDFENTIEFQKIDEDMLLNDTLIDIFGEE